MKAQHHELLSKVIVLLFSVLVWPSLVSWVPQYKTDMKFLENIQKSATKIMKCVEGNLYEGTLFSLEKWRLRRDLIAVTTFL